MTLARRRIAICVAAAASMAASCDIGVSRTLSITNTSDETVWMTIRRPFDNDVRLDEWRELPAGENLVIDEAPACRQVGEVVIASEPDESSTIDIRDLDTDPWCDGDPWEWEPTGR